VTKENSIWITDLKEISEANNESLRRSLITLDGRGEEIKAAALDELIERAYKEGIYVGQESAQ
jgi:hypothetical protein